MPLSVAIESGDELLEGGPGDTSATSDLHAVDKSAADELVELGAADAE
jgi:hypothetical protein